MLLARIALFAALAVAVAAPVGARTITDSAGRTVEIPDDVKIVFTAGPSVAILV
jgi:iron complex transport system substrate-binding protein